MRGSAEEQPTARQPLAYAANSGNQHQAGHLETVRSLNYVCGHFYHASTSLYDRRTYMVLQLEPLPVTPKWVVACAFQAALGVQLYFG